MLNNFNFGGYRFPCFRDFDVGIGGCAPLAFDHYQHLKFYRCCVFCVICDSSRVCLFRIHINLAPGIISLCFAVLALSGAGRSPSLASIQIICCVCLVCCFAVDNIVCASMILFALIAVIDVDDWSVWLSACYRLWQSTVPCFIDIEAGIHVALMFVFCNIVESSSPWKLGLWISLF